MPERETKFHVEPGRRATVWGVIAPSHYKPRFAGICSRQGCESPRDREGQRYCGACHAAYQRRWRKQGGA